jgi:hypothetical protein
VIYIVTEPEISNVMYLTFSLEFYLPVGVEVEFLRLVNLQNKMEPRATSDYL